MYSSVTASKKATAADADYWTANMVSAVRFSEALQALVTSESPDILIEIGPSGALAGPVAQVLKAASGASDVKYHAAWSRGVTAIKTLLTLAGNLYVAGAPINISAVNAGSREISPRTIVDLPNYQWNHSARYWHENTASIDWRTKRFITHDLLGSKIPGTSWKAPTWRKKLDVADVPWLKDHRMGTDVLVPGMAFAAMALEAMYQKHCVLHPDETKDVTGPGDLAYRFRNVKFDRAVVLEEGKPTHLLLTLASVPGSSDWHEFRVRTTADSSQDIIYDHCAGLVRVQDPLGEEHALKGAELAPLRHPQSSAPWYKLQEQMGSHFGPSFRQIKHWETTSGQRTCRATLNLSPPPSKWDPQSSYPIHPAVLDVCQQTATAAFLAGERSELKDVIILSQIDDMVINRISSPTQTAELQDGLSLAEAVWTGRGRKEHVQSWSTNVAVHDPASGAVYVRFRGLRYVRLDVEAVPDSHVFHATHWRPDVGEMTQDQLLYLGLATPTTVAGDRLHEILDLVAFKTPRLSVLEISLLEDAAEGASSSLWLQGTSTRIARKAYSQFTFASTNAKTLVAVETANAGQASSSKFHLLAPNQEALGLPGKEATFDLVIVQATSSEATELQPLLAKLKTLLKPDATTIVAVSPSTTTSSLLQSRSFSDLQDTASDRDGNNEPSHSSGSQTPPRSTSTTPASSVGTGPDLKFPVGDTFQHLLSGVWDTVDVLQIPGRPQSYLYRNANPTSPTSIPPTTQGQILVARFAETTPPISPTLVSMIQRANHSVTQQTIEDLDARPALLDSASVVLVMDELAQSVLTRISESHWESLKRLVGSGKPILWVTKGAQTDRVSDPEKAMVQGLFRVARREDPGARLTTLDVQSPSSPAAHWAIERVLRKLVSGSGVVDEEYAERDGLLLISRVIPDEGLNEFKSASMGAAGLESVVKSFHGNKAQVRLQADKKGSLESLQWCETAVGEVEVGEGMVDIQVMAMGVNFKDVATTMGIVPEDEHMIGCECSGYVRRVGKGVSGFKVGDRVVAQTNGTYVNHLQVVVDRVYPIPDRMSFEDATTIPLVYLTAIYSLYHLGNLQEGQVCFGGEVGQAVANV